MNAILRWWYTFSLPQRGGPDTSPAERERTRYERLTSGLALLILVISVILAPLSFINAYNPWAPRITIISLVIIILAVVFGKMGFRKASASMVILSSMVSVLGTMVTNPLDLSLIPIFDALVITILEAGALLAPGGALLMGGIDCILILLIVTFQHHTAAYDVAMKMGLYAVTVILPITIQIFVAVVAYIIFRNLVLSIRRADRAEEIITLQEQIRASENLRTSDQQTLEEGIELIARVHAQIANGDLRARVPLSAEHVLWAVAGPLNNLLNRAERWKQRSDQMEQVQRALTEVTGSLQQARLYNRPVSIKPTSTIIDPVMREVVYLSEKAQTSHNSSSAL